MRVRVLRFRFVLFLAAGGDARDAAEPPVRPSTQGMLTDHFAAAASPVLRGLPAGQRG